MDRKVSLFLLACLFYWPCFAETWPPLKNYVELCTLIVRCKTEVEGKTVKYKVEESWKGKYSPELFHKKPPTGYLFTNSWHGNESPVSGREVIFFFTNSNQPSWTKGKLLSHSTSFVVNEGKVVYASTNFSMRKEYTVDDFKKKILNFSKKKSPPIDRKSVV